MRKILLAGLGLCLGLSAVNYWLAQKDFSSAQNLPNPTQPDEAEPVLRPEPKPSSIKLDLRRQTRNYLSGMQLARLPVPESPIKPIAAYNQPITPISPKVVKLVPSTPQMPPPSHLPPLLLQVSNISETESVQIEGLTAERPYIDRNLRQQFQDFAETGPVQTQSRGCRSVISTSKVNSVGLEHQLTPRTTVKLDYTYRDGCMRQALKPMTLRDMPSDDGVSLRVNIDF